MSRLTFAQKLEDAADRIADEPREDLQILLRRAAIRLKNASGLALDHEMAGVLDDMAGAMKLTRNELIRTILRDWLIANSYMPANMLEEDGETEGEA